MRNAIAIAGCVAGLGACTIHETYEDGVITGRSMGLGLSRGPACEGTPRKIRSTTIGMHVAPDEGALGYVTRDVFCLPQECRAVFLVEDAAQVGRIRALAGDLAAVCVQPTNQEGKE